MPLTKKLYNIPSTPLMPNCPPNNTRPLIHYPSYFTPPPTPTQLHQTLTTNGWSPKWIFRYGVPHPISHYHSSAHECMVVLSGTAKILFGAADLSSPTPPSTPSAKEGGEELFGGCRQEAGGVIITAHPGDVFILPAGLAHKAVDREGEFALLTPGDGHGVEEAGLEGVELSGFTMMGSYPVDEVHGDWDFREGGEDVGRFEEVWRVPRPEKDPIVGSDREGICGVWGE